MVAKSDQVIRRFFLHYFPCIIVLHGRSNGDRFRNINIVQAINPDYFFHDIGGKTDVWFVKRHSHP